jgi:16S rRNA (guanine966-N2)-methyltransferase
VKIIAGSLKGRNIPFLRNADYRPSTGKLREAIFNILASGEYGMRGVLNNANMLDLFCGTGGISFEAISRGVASSTLIDREIKYLDLAKNTAVDFGIEQQMTFIRADIYKLNTAETKYNLVFMDPPYKDNIFNSVLKILLTKNWLQNDALIVIESAKKVKLKYPVSFRLVDERSYGSSKLSILNYVEK